jgi:hypothetical protein
MGDNQSQVKQAAHPVPTMAPDTSWIQSESSGKASEEERKRREISVSSGEEGDKSLLFNMQGSSFTVMHSPQS